MVTSSLQPKAIKQNLEIAQQLREQGQLDEAIATYQEIIKLQPNHLTTYVQLAKAQEAKDDLEGAIVSYEKILELKLDNPKIASQLAKLYLEVAKKFRKQGQLDEAISTSQKAIELCPNRLSPYLQLAKAQEQKGDLEWAIASSVKVLELDTNNYNAYLRLAELYLKMGQGYLDRVIESYQKAIQIKPDLPFNVYQNLLLALELKGRKEEAKIWLKLAPKPADSKIYSNIWNALNQVELKNIDRENFSCLKKMNHQSVKQFFTQTSEYKVIDLSRCTEEDKKFIKSIDLSLNYLNLNREGLITKEGVFQEKSLKRSTDIEIAEQNKIPVQVREVLDKTNFQFSMVDDGYIYAVCPSTGKILASNRSLVPREGDSIFYRFVGQEVFYLVTGRPETGFAKLCLYFPRTELIFVLSKLPLSREQTFNNFKSNCVNNWEKIELYLLSENDLKKVAIVTFNHFAHHMWNELSGIYRMYKSGDLSKIDEFWIVSEPVGSIQQIFPEIPLEKIKYVNRKNLSQESLDNNYFSFRLGLNFITEDLANRIYQTSIKLCSSAFLAKVEEVKKKHFPLLWISLRLYNRTWISQIEGIANIIKNLAKYFPNLGIVIDGFSLPYNFVSSSSVQATIEQEQETVKNIKSLLPPDIQVYDTVGCMLYESIVWAYAIDLYFVHHGTIQHKVGWTANKPGVVHTSKNLLKKKKSVLELPAYWARENGLAPVYISKDYITDYVDKVKKPLARRAKMNNYDFDWKIAYEELLKLVFSLQNEKMKFYLNEGNQLKKKRKINPAIEQYSQVLTIDPDCIPALSQLAAIYEKKKEFDRASTYYQRITELKPEHYQAQIGLAQIIKNQGNLEEANAGYKKALHSQLTAGLINRTTILQQFIDRKQAKTYLEIGVCTGSNFLQIQAEKKIAVDPKFQIPGGYISDENDRYYEMTSDDFFADRSELLTKYGLDIVLVDGLHTYEQSLKDVLNSLELLNNGGIIVLHDCHPTSEAAGHPIVSEAKKISSWTGAWMGDVWKTVVYLRSLKSDLNVFVLNCDCGVGIVTKGTPENMLKYSAEEIANLTYEDFQVNKVKLLNLKKANYFDSFLANMSISSFN